MREDYLNSDKNTTSKDKEFENILGQNRSMIFLVRIKF